MSNLMNDTPARVDDLSYRAGYDAGRRDALEERLAAIEKDARATRALTKDLLELLADIVEDKAKRVEERREQLTVHGRHLSLVRD